MLRPATSVHRHPEPVEKWRGYQTAELTRGGDFLEMGIAYECCFVLKYCYSASLELTFLVSCPPPHHPPTLSVLILISLEEVFLSWLL